MVTMNTDLFTFCSKTAELFQSI